MKQKVLIAVDAGGSKTEFGVSFLSGGDVRTYVYGGSNYHTIGVEKARANLVDSFFATCKAENVGLEDVQGAVFGVAGCDTPEDMRVYSEMIASIGLAASQTAIYNDCELAFLAAAEAPGICLVAGTGSNSMAFHPDKPMMRAGGWNALLSDDGSGFWIAQKVMREMLLFCDGSGVERPIYKAIMAHFGIVDFSAVQIQFAVMNVATIASAARVIIEFAAAGDTYAREVVSAAHEGLWELSAALLRRMDYSPEKTLHIVLNGSLFKNEWFLTQFWDGLCARVKNPLKRHLVTANTSENAMRLAQRLYGEAE